MSSTNTVYWVLSQCFYLKQWLTLRKLKHLVSTCTVFCSKFTQGYTISQWFLIRQNWLYRHFKINIRWRCSWGSCSVLGYSSYFLSLHFLQNFSFLFFNDFFLFCHLCHLLFITGVGITKCIWCLFWFVCHDYCIWNRNNSKWPNCIPHTKHVLHWYYHNQNSRELSHLNLNQLKSCWFNMQNKVWFLVFKCLSSTCPVENFLIAHSGNKQ